MKGFIILIILIIVMLILWSLAIREQMKMLYRPLKEHRWIPSYSYKNLNVEGMDVWYFDTFNQLKSRNIDNKVILHCHGNTGNISHLKEIISLAYLQKYNILVFDYYGYGKSIGSPHPDVQYKNGETIYQYMIKELKINSKDIIIWGESLGGSVATHIASKYDCYALILLSTFSSLDDLLRDKIPRFKTLFAPIITRNLFNTLPSKDKIKNVKCPVAILHSVDDDIIPIESAERLYNNISHNAKRLIKIKGIHSNPIISIDNIEELFSFVGMDISDCKYASRLLEYLKEAI